MGSRKRPLNDPNENTAELARQDRRLRSSSTAGMVFTTKGLRARRLRLSAPTAIQFYDVQDRLGCERPTEAIDWLLQNAKSAIDALSEPVKTDIVCRNQNFSFLSMATSSSSSQFKSSPLQNLSPKGNFSVLSPMILNASPSPLSEFSGEEPPSYVSQINGGTGFPSFPMWE